MLLNKAFQPMLSDILNIHLNRYKSHKANGNQNEEFTV